MHGQKPNRDPDVNNLDVLAYELNALALRVAAQAEAFSRRNADAPPPDQRAEVAAQMNRLIGELQRGARTLAYARRTGGIGGG